jgi:hypothetical protein
LTIFLPNYIPKEKIETLIASHEGETGTYEEAREKHWMNLPLPSSTV